MKTQPGSGSRARLKAQSDILTFTFLKKQKSKVSNVSFHFK